MSHLNEHSIAGAPGEMQITERELAHMTADLADAHADSLPQMREAVEEWTAQHSAGSTPNSPLARTFTRRRALALGGLAAGGIALAACSSSSGSTTPTTGGAGATSGKAAAGAVPTDVRVAALAASLENLAVGTYGAGLAAAGAGKLGTVPPAVATFAKSAIAQHKEHAAAWNAILANAGFARVTGVDTAVKPIVDSAFAKVTNVTGLAQLALLLENVAAATYLNGLTVVSSKEAVATAASIQPVEMQHVAILRFVLGEYPVPSAFASVSGARPVSDYPRLAKA